MWEAPGRDRGSSEPPGDAPTGGDALGGAPDSSRPANPWPRLLAFAAVVRSSWGDLPFPDLPSLGGSDTLRGYLADRFTGQAAWHASAEWRLWCLPRGVRLGS
ncbi:MAG: hypothetical protein WCI61_02280, partial [Chloroflexota bacterium]